MTFWKAMAIVMAVVFISSAVPRVLLMIERREEKSCQGLVAWFHDSNMPVIVGLIISLIIIVAAFFIRG